MSSTDIAAIQQAAAITDTEYRKAYRNIIQIIPLITNTLNHASAKPARKARKIEEIKAYIDNNLQTMIVALQTPSNAAQDVPPIPLGEE